MLSTADHVLIVDDDADARRLSETQLTSRGFVTTAVPDGPSALKLIEQQLPAVVLLDLDMPDMDGLAVLHQIRSKWTPDRLPVVMVTGLTDDAVVVQGLQAGANDFVIKPVPAQVLAARVESCLSMKRLAEERDRSKDLLEYQQKLRALASQVALAEEKERRRIAQGLHDQIGQALAVAKMKVASLHCEDGSCSPAVLTAIAQSIEQAIKHVRGLTFELGSRVLYDFGLEAALENVAESARQNGLTAHFEDDGQPKPLPEWIKVTLLQAVKELVHNVEKHAQASEVRISISRHDQRVEVAVDDNGVGCDQGRLTPVVDRNGGFGLFSIRERMDFMGGTARIRTAPGQGMCVTLSVPIAPVAPGQEIT